MADISNKNIRRFIKEVLSTEERYQQNAKKYIESCVKNM